MKIHKLDWLDWLTFILCVWFLIYPHPYILLFTILLLLPIIGLVLKGHSKPSFASLITITSGKDGGTDFETADFIVLPALILFLRMLIDFEIENYFDLLSKSAVAFIILLAILRLFYRNVEKENRHKVLTYFVVLGNIAIYSFAAVYGINCVYDNSKPQVYQVPVIDKSIYRGKHTTYYLKVRSWNNKKDNEKISVVKDQYNNTNIGDTVNVDIKEGLLKSPWHFIE